MYLFSEGTGEYLKEKRISSGATATLPLSSSSVGGGRSDVSERHRERTRTGVGETLESHELELASSLDRELQDLLHH